MYQGMSHADAGTELYVLATQFLLYIALVILTILLQRVYFPHTMPDGPYTAEPVGSKVDDEEVAAEFGEFESEAPLVASEDGAEAGGGLGAPPELRREKSLEELSVLASMVDFRNFEQEHMTKRQVLTRLLTCAVGLNVSFVVAGILQERMLTMPYDGGEYFTSSYGLVFLNRLGGMLISALLYYHAQPPPTSAVGSPAAWDVCPEGSKLVALWLNRPLAPIPPRPPSVAGRVRVQLPVRVQHAEQLVPVRGAQVRVLSDPDARQVLQGRPHHAHGKVPREQGEFGREARPPPFTAQEMSRALIRLAGVPRLRLRSGARHWRRHHSLHRQH